VFTYQTTFGDIENGAAFAFESREKDWLAGTIEEKEKIPNISISFSHVSKCRNLKMVGTHTFVLDKHTFPLENGSVAFINATYRKIENHQILILYTFIHIPTKYSTCGWGKKGAIFLLDYCEPAGFDVLFEFFTVVTFLVFQHFFGSNFSLVNNTLKE